MSGDSGAGPQFGRFRLAGGRYDRPGLPVATATELHRYEKLVVEVARLLFLQDHPRRKRAPRRFDRSLDLRISGVVEEGSVVPTLVRGQDDLGVTIVYYHERARRLINEALGSVNDGGSLPGGFPVEALAEFSSFGRTLDEHESIELSEAHEARAVLTQQTRRRIRALASSDEVEVELSVVGQVTGLRSARQQFDLLLDHGRTVEGSYLDAGTWEDLHRFAGYREQAPLAALSVVARQTLSGDLIGILDVLGVEAALPPEWADRIRELAGLRTGWLLEESAPPSRDALDLAERFLLACVDESIPRPGIYPSADGGVQLEWKTPQRALEVEIDNEGSARLWVLDLEGDDDTGHDIGRDIDLLLDLLVDQW